MPIENTAAVAFELGLVALGWFLLWRFCFSRRAHGHGATPPQLPHWNLSLSNFAAAALCVGGGWFFSSLVFGHVLQNFPSIKSDETLTIIIAGSVSQIGILLGAIGAWFYVKNTAALAPAPAANATEVSESSQYRLWPSALVTVVVTISVVHPVQWIWEWLLTLWHLPTASQDVVGLFFRNQSPGRIAALALVAVVIAPVMEEMVFRAGLFRYVRGRLPRWLALSLPALLFASLHVNSETLAGLVTLAPLAALGIVFSLAYERTGRIAVVMLAHALFNLHTLVFLLLGLTD